MMYVVLAFVAIILIGITIGLQVMILSDREVPAVGSVETPTSGQVTAATGQENTTQENSTQENSTVASVDTPVVIVIEPTVAPTDLPTETPVEPPTLIPTATVAPPTPVPPTPVPPTVVPPTATTAPEPAVLEPIVEDNRSIAIDAIINAENITVSSDDNLVLEIVKNNLNTTGFVGRAYFLSAQDSLRALDIRLDDGRIVKPSAENVFDGSYPISRYLYIYTTRQIIQQKPEVAAFVGCYLNQVNAEILDIGFFPARQSVFAETVQTFNGIVGNPGATNAPSCSLDGIGTGNIDIAGSTTVAPVSQRMVDRFIDLGFANDIRVDAIGTGSGFERFCIDGTEDIVNADRQITAEELASCRAIGREPIGLAIGEDALSVIVSAENSFADVVSINQLRKLFTVAQRWSDVDANWPAELISRAVPSQSGGTFATFVDQVFIAENRASTIAQIQPVATAVPNIVQPLETNTSVPTRPPSTATPFPDVDFGLAYVEGHSDCLLATTIAQSVLEEQFSLTSTLIPFQNIDILFDTISAIDGAEQALLTLCYTDPDDRSALLAQGSWISFIGSGYQKMENKRMYIAARSGLAPTLERDSPCVYDFFKKFNLGEEPLDSESAAEWVVQNTALVDSWLTCGQ